MSIALLLREWHHGVNSARAAAVVVIVVPAISQLAATRAVFRFSYTTRSTVSMTRKISPSLKSG